MKEDVGDPAEPAGLLSPSAMEPPAASPPKATIPIAMDDMDDTTLTALRGSIAKWEAIVAGTGGDQGPNNCPLCHLFHGAGCQNCPVAVAVERDMCAGTPYDDWSECPGTRFLTTLGWVVGDDESRRLAQAELDFLKSLLPAQGIVTRRDETPLGGSGERSEVEPGPAKQDAPE